MKVKKYDAALADYSEAILLAPSGAAAYDSRANARQKLGDERGEAEDRAKARALGPPPGERFSESNSGLHKVGGSVSAPKLIKRVEPNYRPRPARRRSRAWWLCRWWSTRTDCPKI